MRATLGLQLNFEKMAIMNYGTIDNGELKDTSSVLEVLASGRMRVSLGFLVSATADDYVWASALQKYLARVAYERHVVGFTGDRLIAYGHCVPRQRRLPPSWSR